MLLALQKDLVYGSPQRYKDVTLPMAGAKTQYLQSAKTFSFPRINFCESAM